MLENKRLKPQEAAEYIGCSYWKIMDLVRKNQIPFYRIGNRVLFTQLGLDKWIKKQEQDILFEDNNILDLSSNIKMIK